MYWRSQFEIFRFMNSRILKLSIFAFNRRKAQSKNKLSRTETVPQEIIQQFSHNLHKFMFLSRETLKLIFAPHS